MIFKKCEHFLLNFICRSPDSPASTPEYVHEEIKIPSQSPPKENYGSLGSCLEAGVRDLIINLKIRREKVRGSLLDLRECWNLDFFESTSPATSPASDPLENRRLDLETALLMQELMASREDSAELRSQIFLLQKENGSLQLKARRGETEKLGLLAIIRNLDVKCLSEGNSNHGVEVEGKVEGPSNENEENGNDPTEYSRKNYKERISDLLSTLEKVKADSVQHHGEEESIIEELKETNELLLKKLQSAKAKYERRISKMEEQMVSLMEKYAIHHNNNGQRHFAKEKV